jgi:type II secretory pathway component GspD/PulD (secretin)
MELTMRLRDRSVVTASLIGVLAIVCSPGAVSAQAVRVSEDSVRVSLVNTDIRAAIQAIGQFLTKPVLTGPLGDVRVEVFETPVPVHRSVLPDILRGLVEANGLVFAEDESFYRVSAPRDARTDDVAQPPAAQDVTPFRLFTVRLSHARAIDVAATLNQLYGTGVDFSRPAGLSSGSLSDQLRADRERAAQDPQDFPAEVEQGALLRGQVTIVPDESTNSLLIRSMQSDFDVLEEGIAQLDVRPLQVLIEVVVVEARRDRQFALGFDVRLPPRDFRGAVVEGELVGGGLGDFVVRVMGLGKADVNAALIAARLRGDVEIMSRPVLLASNNTEARLLVGTQQPFVQVSRSLPTDTPQRDQVVQYRDVGTKLTVRPTINQDGYVTLFIQQELSAATGDIQFNAPVIASREATTQVLVADRQTIVIGGLRDELKDEVRTGIPLLADVPLLGGLFGSTRSRTTETELFLFITPTIITNDVEMLNATIDRIPERLLRSNITNDVDMLNATIDRVPERLLRSTFITGAPIEVPPVRDCEPGQPGCGS